MDVKKGESTLNLHFSKAKYDEKRGAGPPAIGGVQTIYVDPGVMVRVVDHYVREHVGDDNSMIVGVLLGNRSNYGTVATVKDCFPVKLMREEKANRVDYRYSGDTFRKTLALSEQANPDQVFLGWYTIGTEIGMLSKVVKDIFEQVNSCRGQSIYLLVDNSFKTESLGYSAYTSVPASIPGSKTMGMMCIPVNCVIGGLSKFTNDDIILKTTALKDRVTDLPSNLENMEYFVDYLHKLIRGIIEYIDKILEKKITPNPTIGRHIMDCVLTHSSFDPELYTEKFSNNLHDLLSVSYLATLAKSQLVIVDKIQKLSSYRYFSE